MKELIELKERYKKLGKKTPFVFDTDAGHDPDDLKVIIAGLINDPAIDIKMITTVGEFPDVKASIIKSVLIASDRADIPVYCGEGLYLRDLQLPDGTRPKTIDEALTIPAEEQVAYLEKRYPTYPGRIFGGFYPFQGRAWLELKPYNKSADGQIEDAVKRLRDIVSENKTSEEPSSEEPSVVVVSTGELSNIATFYKNGFAGDIIVHHMGGWSGKNNNKGEKDIFPRQFLGRNSIADIVAASTVFNDPKKHLILYMSHLKKQYELELTSGVRKLLCLIDQFPIEDLSEPRLNNLLIMLIKDLNPIDAPSNIEFQQLWETITAKATSSQQDLKTYINSRDLSTIICALDLADKKRIIGSLLPTAGVSSLPHASVLGRCMGRDFANWLAQTAFPYIICSDPGTFLTATNPELVTSCQNVDIRVDAEKSILQGQKFLESLFDDTVTTLDSGPISAITELASAEAIMQPIITGLLNCYYPGVTYEQFMSIANSQELTLVVKTKQLNDLCVAYYRESIQGVVSSAPQPLFARSLYHHGEGSSLNVSLPQSGL